MAEAAVTFALGEIRDLLVAEGRLLSGVSGEVRALETQLEEIKCLLEDADRRRHESKTIFNWLMQIRDLAYRAEAAIEVHAARVSSSRRRRGLRQLMKRYSCYIMNECCTLHQLGSDILEIKSELERVTGSMQAYGINRIIGESAGSQNSSKKAYPDFEIGDCFVGMKEDLKKLESLLVEDKERRVISVWGMGGSGKTTIARKFYNQLKETKNGRFDLFAWVCITQQCQSRSVLEDVLKQLESGKRKDVSSLSETELMERLCELQRDKRCLIVVDDLWEKSHWDGFSHAFLVHDLQSKILVTTREKTVAEIGFPLELGLLNTNDAWELLKKKAFPNTNIPDFAFEENLEKIGKEMVRKCGHLPLAISLLGGVLRKKNSMVEWELVNKNINTLMYRDEKEIDGVLNLSYENLPFYLKPCFLYMGMFKEDEDIGTEDLYRMWMAQGMISYKNITDKDKTLMDIAELYLSELASRSLVQVEFFDDAADAGKYWGCKLHDVIRELCLKMGKKEDFGLQILKYEGEEIRTLLPEESSHIIRHLSIHFTGVKLEYELTITRGEDTSKHLRSLQILNHGYLDAIECSALSIVDFCKFKLLRDLVIVKFKFAGRKLPRGITNLIHLRSLYLKGCEVDELPSSVRNLVYLDTLDLTESKNVIVPNIFKEMFRLKHLILPPYDDEEIIGKYRFRLDVGVDELETLEGLDSRVHELKSSFMGRMKKLQRFLANIYDNESLSGIMNAIAKNLNKLVQCMVIINEGCELKEAGLLKKALFTSPNLHLLAIENVKLGKVVAECGKSELLSSNLKYLHLCECEIEEDSMGILGNLPCLIELILGRRSFVGEEMTCSSLSFPRLKELKLDGLPKLREWRVEVGAMSRLSEITIWHCDRLEMVPDGLSTISTLHKLTIGSEMAELVERVSSPSGLDFHKVSHIPSIIID